MIPCWLGCPRAILCYPIFNLADAQLLTHQPLFWKFKKKISNFETLNIILLVMLAVGVMFLG